MKFVVLPPLSSNRDLGRWLGDGHVADLARTAEEVGFDAIAETDHPFPPEHFLQTGGHHTLDLFVALSYAAASTTRLCVMTNIMVAGYRNPYLAAKACATLDRLSGGRLIVGMGSGYLREEFEVLGADFDHRREQFDETVRAMKRAWTGEPVTGSESFYPADGHVMQPAPAAEGGPPVWIGGNSRRAIRRAAEIAEGWMPMPSDAKLAAFAGTAPLDSIGLLRDRVLAAQNHRAELGRPPLTICTGPFTYDRDMTERFRAVARDLAAFEDAGVDWLSIALRSRSLVDAQREAELFAEMVIEPHRAR
jgi:probable F420-dependent oxidoreductase